MDIIASNWGLNSSYQPSPEYPVGIFYGDFAERGAVDLPFIAELYARFVEDPGSVDFRERLQQMAVADPSPTVQAKSGEYLRLIHLAAKDSCAVVQRLREFF